MFVGISFDCFSINNAFNIGVCVGLDLVRQPSKLSDHG